MTEHDHYDLPFEFLVTDGETWTEYLEDRFEDLSIEVVGAVDAWEDLPDAGETSVSSRTQWPVYRVRDDRLFVRVTDTSQEILGGIGTGANRLPTQFVEQVDVENAPTEGTEVARKTETDAIESDVAGKADDPHGDDAHTFDELNQGGPLAEVLDADGNDVTNIGATETDSVTNSDYNESVETHTGSGTITIDLSVANVHRIEATENVTIEFSNVTSTPPGNSLLLKFIDDDNTGPHTITWPASVIWDGGNARDEIPAESNLRVSLETDDAGTEWWAVRSGRGFE